MPEKMPSLRTLTTPNMWSSQSKPNGSLVWPTRSITYDDSEDDEDADMLLDDEDEEDMLLEDLEITASSFSSFLSPSPF